MTLYELGSLCLSALTFIVLALTLWFVRSYTRETAVLAKAAAEQMPRPCVIITEARDHTTEAIIHGTNVSLDPLRTLRLTNVGTGPAINIRLSFTPIGSSQPEVELRGPTLAPAASFDSDISRNGLSDPAVVVIDYESLGGTKYSTEIEIEERRWVRSVRFR